MKSLSAPFRYLFPNTAPRVLFAVKVGGSNVESSTATLTQLTEASVDHFASNGNEGEENNSEAQQAELEYQQQMQSQAEVQSAASKLSEYMQTTQDAASRAAAAQARVAKFLAAKQPNNFVAKEVTVPKTPTVMRRSQK